MTSLKQKPYPSYICHDCGTEFCSKVADSQTTYHIGDCRCCGRIQLPVTNPLSYGGLSVWPLPSGSDPDPLPESVADLPGKVLMYFDFEKVHNAMVALDWRWLMPGSSLEIPSVTHLRCAALELLDAAVDHEPGWETGKGGLYAKRMEDGLRLSFEVASWQCSLEDYLD